MLGEWDTREQSCARRNVPSRGGGLEAARIYKYCVLSSWWEKPFWRRLTKG